MAKDGGRRSEQRKAVTGDEKPNREVDDSENNRREAEVNV